MSFFIGEIKIKNPIILAPMAGVSNPSYMRICEEMGASYAITELISSEAIVRNNQKTLAMLKGIEKLRIPVAIQLFGSIPETMAKAAKIITKLYPKVIIDINMGCPVPKVAIAAGSGSALLKDPQKIKEIVTAVTKSVTVPVTVKIRLGWDESSINCREVAKIIEESGAKAIALHARTRSEGYSGVAHWEYIKEVKESVSIPVIGNGDIKNVNDALRMLEETNCDAVMIGRGVLGNPWLIRDCVNYLERREPPKPVSIAEKIAMIKKHFAYLKEDKNEKLALLEIRSHILYYLKGMPHAKEIKQKICETKTENEIIAILDAYLLENTPES